ncbi:MAG: hypothetical protein QM731_18975 [Chitinophagaceae bacterium]
MRKITLICITALLVLGLSKCGKSGGGSSSCSETAMTVTTSPAIGTVDPPAPGPNFPLQVNITANLPSAGATVVVTAKPESTGTAFFTETRVVTAANNTFTITNTPASTSCIVTVTVTSKSCASNTFSGTYRYSRK